VSLALFVGAFLISMELEWLLFIVPVLFFHEAGHWLGMRLFGYRNVRMFFIPFFGAAVSGTKHAAPAWQQAVVLLLGPLPGIAIGLALQAIFAPDIDSRLGKLVFTLVILNGINLAPWCRWTAADCSTCCCSRAGPGWPSPSGFWPSRAWWPWRSGGPRSSWRCWPSSS